MALLTVALDSEEGSAEAAGADSGSTIVALATEVVEGGLEHRVLVGFCLIESAWAWIPSDQVAALTAPGGRLAHPVLTPCLDAFTDVPSTDGLPEVAVRHVLVEAFSHRDSAAYVRLLCDLATRISACVDDLPARLRARGLLAATGGSAGRHTGPG